MRTTRTTTGRMEETMTKNIEGWGELLGFISFADTERGATHSRGWWLVTDADGAVVKRISDSEDRQRVGRLFERDRAVTDDDVLALARTVYPSAIRLGDTEVMANAGVIDSEGGYAILR